MAFNFGNLESLAVFMGNGLPPNLFEVTIFLQGPGFPSGVGVGRLGGGLGEGDSSLKGEGPGGGVGKAGQLAGDTDGSLAVACDVVGNGV